MFIYIYKKENILSAILNNETSKGFYSPTVYMLSMYTQHSKAREISVVMYI